MLCLYLLFRMYLIKILRCAILRLENRPGDYQFSFRLFLGSSFLLLFSQTFCPGNVSGTSDLDRSGTPRTPTICLDSAEARTRRSRWNQSRLSRRKEQCSDPLDENLRGEKTQRISTDLMKGIGPGDALETVIC